MKWEKFTQLCLIFFQPLYILDIADLTIAVSRLVAVSRLSVAHGGISALSVRKLLIKDCVAQRMAGRHSAETSLSFRNLESFSFP